VLRGGRGGRIDEVRDWLREEVPCMLLLCGWVCGRSGRGRGLGCYECEHVYVDGWITPL